MEFRACCHDTKESYLGRRHPKMAGCYFSSAKLTKCGSLSVGKFRLRRGYGLGVAQCISSGPTQTASLGGDGIGEEGTFRQLV